MPTREPRLDGGDHKHPLGPLRHALLGLKIGLSALLFALGIWVCAQGFKRADNSLERILDGRKVHWSGFGVWLSVNILGAGLSAGVLTYWLSLYG